MGRGLTRCLRIEQNSRNRQSASDRLQPHVLIRAVCLHTKTDEKWRTHSVEIVCERLNRGWAWIVCTYRRWRTHTVRGVCVRHYTVRVQSSTLPTVSLHLRTLIHGNWRMETVWRDGDAWKRCVYAHRKSRRNAYTTRRSAFTQRRCVYTKVRQPTHIHVFIRHYKLVSGRMLCHTSLDYSSSVTAIRTKSLLRLRPLCETQWRHW